MTSSEATSSTAQPDAWRGFQPGLWQRDINVRWFIQRNYTPHEGDGTFLAPATERTKNLWKRLEALFVEERKKGVLDVSQIPSSITAHAPGYIDRENEIIVGLQTDAPLKRAIMPNGGLRMVLSSLKAYGYTPDPVVVEAFTKYRKTYNDGVFDAYTADIRCCRYGYVHLDNAASQPGTTYHETHYGSANIMWQIRQRLSVGLEELYGYHDTKDGSHGDVYRTTIGMVYSIF